MFLEVPGFMLPTDMRIHAVTDRPPLGTWGGERPKHLIPLGESSWPDEIKQAIVKIFNAKGLSDPMRQKIIEPMARVFGGMKTDGAIDLLRVNWELVVDYFTWEAESIMHTNKAKKLQKQAKKKYGGIFSHYRVYELPYDRSYLVGPKIIRNGA
jgi:hypothetical protein